MEPPNGTPRAPRARAVVAFLVERLERVEVLLQSALPAALDEDTAVAIAEAVGDLDELREVARTFLGDRPQAHGAIARLEPRLLEARAEIARLETRRLRAIRGELIERSHSRRAAVEAERQQRVVDRAIGLLMARHHLVAEEARASIELAATHQRRSPADVASRLVIAHELAVYDERRSP